MNRIDVINNLIKNNNYKSYLEIGVQNGESFYSITCDYKVGIDPDIKSKATHFMLSDDFFKRNKEKFDIIFIDGLHTREACINDIKNSIDCLSDNGVIVVHDLLPQYEAMQQVPRGKQRQWTGDVWRSWLYMRANSDWYFEVYDFDFGVGVISNDITPIFISDHSNIKFVEWQKNRNELMNVVEYESRQIL